jgi:hypothetical protein
MSEELAAYLRFFGAFMAILRPLIMAVILLGLWLALRRTQIPPRSSAAMWLFVAVPLVGWLVFIWIVAAAGGFEARRGEIPRLPFAVAVPILLALTLLTRSDRMAAVADVAPPSWLIGLQVFRIFGANFLVQWAFGAIPGAFALPAGIGDVLVGVLALPVAFYLASGRPAGRIAAVAWNVLGITDLVMALTLGFLTSPALQILAVERPSVLVTSYPTVMTPAFAVPLALILHGLSLWQLRRLSRSKQGVSGSQVAVDYRPAYSH